MRRAQIKRIFLKPFISMKSTRQANAFLLFFILLTMGQFHNGQVESGSTRNFTQAHAATERQKGETVFQSHFRQPSGEDQDASPIKQFEDFGLIEVSEREIPDDAQVYVYEKPAENSPMKIKGEVMETADNIVFRPLFRYRDKQEALRRRDWREGNARRYFVPKTLYGRDRHHHRGNYYYH